MNKLSIKNFKAFYTAEKYFEIEFNNKHFLLYGDNGAGKSSIAEAIKIALLKNKLLPNIPSNKSPEDKKQIINDFWSSFTNKKAYEFELKINDIDYIDFDNSRYNLFTFSLDEIFCIDKNLKYTDIIKNIFYIDDKEKFCLDNWQNISININQILKTMFKEDFEIDINAEENFEIRVKNEKLNLPFTNEFATYLNEARINLIMLLLFFESIKLLPKKEKNILLLDDFITSLDVANRTFIIKYIFDNFKEFQLIVFTHNIFFYNLMMYLINNYYDKDEKLNKDRWQFANLYEIADNHKIYIKGQVPTVEKLRKEFETEQNPEEFGNKIRQKFEVLLYELSKFLIVGAVEESKDIIVKIENGKSIFLQDQILRQIESLLDNENVTNDELEENITNIFQNSKLDGLKDIQNIIRDMKLYQKLTLHPMSHGKLGQSPFTINEIQHSLDLLEKLEANINKIAKKYHINMEGA